MSANQAYAASPVNSCSSRNQAVPSACSVLAASRNSAAPASAAMMKSVRMKSFLTLATRPPSALTTPGRDGIRTRCMPSSRARKQPRIGPAAPKGKRTRRHHTPDPPPQEAAQHRAGTAERQQSEVARVDAVAGDELVHLDEH